MLRFAEEMILLLLRDEDGTFVHVPNWSVDRALAGAVLMDLALENRIDTDLENLVLVDSTPLGDSILDATLADIAAEETRDPRFWVERVAQRAPRSAKRSSIVLSMAASLSARTTDSSGFSAPAATPWSMARPSAK